jgi:membrane protease YdiL (CAAX protease family)
LGEELGWRGYALPRLLTRWNATACALLLGAIWVIWHVPAFFVSGIMGGTLSGFGWWALDTISLSVFMTWIFVNTKGSVLVAGIVPHFVVNGLGAVGAWLSRPAEAVAIALVAVLAVAVSGWNLRRGEPLSL